MTFTFTFMDYVLSAVRAEVLCVIQKAVNHQGRAMAQTVSRRPLTTGAGFDTKSIHMMFVVDTATLGHVFPQYFCFPCRYHANCSPY